MGLARRQVHVMSAPDRHRHGRRALAQHETAVATHLPRQPGVEGGGGYGCMQGERWTLSNRNATPPPTPNPTSLPYLLPPATSLPVPIYRYLLPTGTYLLPTYLLTCLPTYLPYYLAYYYLRVPTTKKTSCMDACECDSTTYPPAP